MPLSGLTASPTPHSHGSRYTLATDLINSAWICVESVYLHHVALGLRYGGDATVRADCQPHTPQPRLQVHTSHRSDQLSMDMCRISLPAPRCPGPEVRW